METLLQQIVASGRYGFADRADSWQEAVRLGAEPLVRTGCADENYYRQIVACMEEFGPYAVFDHLVAMPHTRAGADGALKTAVSLVIFREPVDFGVDEEGERKRARLLFTLSVRDANEHLDSLNSLMEIFCDEPLLDALMEAETPEDILRAENNYPPTSIY